MTTDRLLARAILACNTARLLEHETRAVVRTTREQRLLRSGWSFMSESMQLRRLKLQQAAWAEKQQMQAVVPEHVVLQVLSNRGALAA